MRIIILNNDMISFVDDEDYEELNKYKWFAHKHRNTFYAERASSKKDNPDFKQHIVKMHRLITSCPNNMQIDHVNGNGLDNRKENLRIVTNRENGQNRHEITSSKYNGVRWHKASSKWEAQIKFNGKNRYLGVFDNELDAATAYRVACVYLTGKDPINLNT